MFDPPLLNIVDSDRQIVKQGAVMKVAKRNGELLVRHLALVGRDRQVGALKFTLLEKFTIYKIYFL
jgi:hypothetical protein